MSIDPVCGMEVDEQSAAVRKGFNFCLLRILTSLI